MSKLSVLIQNEIEMLKKTRILEYIKSILLLKVLDLNTISSNNIKVKVGYIQKAIDKSFIEICKAQNCLHICSALQNRLVTHTDYCSDCHPMFNRCSLYILYQSASYIVVEASTYFLYVYLISFLKDAFLFSYGY